MHWRELSLVEFISHLGSQRNFFLSLGGQEFLAPISVPLDVLLDDLVS
jgi:hypothetical protein